MTSVWGVEGSEKKKPQWRVKSILFTHPKGGWPFATLLIQDGWKTDLLPVVILWVLEQEQIAPIALGNVFVVNDPYRERK